jgi:hypothetical protein
VFELNSFPVPLEMENYCAQLRKLWAWRQIKIKKETDKLGLEYKH